MNDESTQAKALLGHLLQDEPPVAVDSAALVRKGRRHTAIVRSAAIGSATLGVVGAIFATTLVQPGPQEISAALPWGSSSEQPPGFGDSSSTLPLKPGITACRVGMPNCPSPDFTEDDRSRALTSALLDAPTRLVPDSTIVRGSALTWPETENSPFRVVKPTRAVHPDWPYVGSAEVGDLNNGFGSVFVYVSDRGTDGRCATLDRSQVERLVSTPPLKIVEFVDCRDETLADGTAIAVSTYRGRNEGGYTGQEGYLKKVVDAARPDGTRVRVSVDNSAPQQASTGHQPTALALPLTDQHLITIATLPKLKY